jgi:unsaturated pyranuronate lyase
VANETVKPEWLFNLYDENQGIARQLAEGVSQRIFVGENIMMSVARFDAHSESTVHSHPEEQWGVLIEGACTRIQGGEEIPVKTGDFWYTPANVSHGVRTGSAAAVVLDIFSPPRPEYRNDK